MTAPSVAAEGLATHLLAVVLDRAHARFFDVGNGAAVEVTDLWSPGTRGGRFHSDRQDAPGSGEAGYHHRLQEEERRHFQAIVARIRAWEGPHGSRGILLAGPGTIAVGLRRFLPADLRARVAGTARLNPLEVTPAVVQKAARRARKSYERTSDCGIIESLREGLGTGLAVSGIPATLRALAERRVRVLVIAADVRGPAYRCARTGRLVLTAPECAGEGGADAVVDLLREAVLEARRQRARVRVVRDRDLALGIAGLAALLRYR
jgi:peptide subunit release factor 1 (eRF1)